jgi:hypothetical protein
MAEELALEAAALEAIFAGDFTAEELADQQVRWSLRLRRDQAELVLTFLVSTGYPQTDVPQIKVVSVAGPSPQSVRMLESYLRTIAEENRGSPSVYLLYTAAQDWIDKHIESAVAAGGDQSSHPHSDRDRIIGTTTAEQSFAAPGESFSQFVEHETTEHATIERALGTPVTAETFAIWKEAFHRYLIDHGILEATENPELDQRAQVDPRSNNHLKPTGRELFSIHREMFSDDLDAQGENDEMTQAGSIVGEARLAEQVDATLFLS